MRVPAVVTALCLAPALAAPQSLGDAARRQAHERSKQAPQTRVYTEADLHGKAHTPASAPTDPPATPTRADANAASVTSPAQGTSEDAVRAQLDREAEARKEATVKNAEAMAQAKVIDSHAELERQGLMAKAEEQRIRLVAGADAERLRTEAQVLKDNPLLIQKIIAERLSDKVQIMMVPMDGKFFFANDVLRAPQIGIGMQK